MHIFSMNAKPQSPSLIIRLTLQLLTCRVCSDDTVSGFSPSKYNYNHSQRCLERSLTGCSVQPWPQGSKHEALLIEFKSDGVIIGVMIRASRRVSLRSQPLGGNKKCILKNSCENERAGDHLIFADFYPS